MIQRCYRARFALKAFVEAFGGKLDGNFAAESRIDSAVDLAHAARAEIAEDLVGA
jgi:hypothetical protein